MRLAAVIIVNHFLIDTPSIINFGGQFIYHFEMKKTKVQLYRIHNEKYIDNFFGNQITNLSAIVGANGVGKTSVMRILNKIKDDTKAIFIYEDEASKVKIENRTGNINEHGFFTTKSQFKVFFEKEELVGIKDANIPSLYYSPIVDFDLISIESPISQTEHFKQGLEDFHLDTVERNVLFMSDDIINELTKVYHDIPFYNKLNIRPKQHYKRDLRKVYGGFEVKGDVESAQEKYLDELWAAYGIATKDKDQYIHDSTDFFRDLEINIFSFLIIDGTAMMTTFNGGFELSLTEIHSKATFEEKLKHTFFRKIFHIDKYIGQELKLDFKDDYHMLLFISQESNFDQEIKRKEAVVMRIITDAEPAVRSSNPKKSIKAFINLISDIKKELVGSEFQYINENLNKVIDSLPKIRQKDLPKRLILILENLRINIPKSFDIIYRNRYEIIDQLKDAALRNIRLFDGIHRLYLALEKLNSKSGIKIIDGILTLNLSEIDNNDFKLVIKNYRTVLSEFHSNSVIGRVQLLEFFPDKRFSFGEKSLLSFFGSMFEFTLNKHYHQRRKKNYLLLLDETDLGYHPLWKKKFISALVKVLPVIFSRLEYDIENEGQIEVGNNPFVQIVLTTHDALTLSDVPNSHITYLNKSEERTLILNQRERPENSFGANITDLLADSFFVGNGLLGDFALDKITETIQWLNFKKLELDIKENSEIEDNIELVNLKKKELSNLKDKIGNNSKIYHEQIINIVDEPVMKTKLMEMYSEVFGENEKHAEIELKRLANKLGYTIFPNTDNK
ncbi:ATP-binding protein [Maribacter dokdonensis]|uniref:ATP-binding protein n=1 Tax=Maribacter dokdonensis TaxID=320912 RepID=UPI001C0834A1|nr:ATP-binding protein [Maribacter dokdonensis]MBU2901560.1 ATP-binding protein [Maribacter dokdonensis]